MKIRHIGSQMPILVLAVGILICWTVAGNTSEHWDAKASARVNLRRNPSSNGVILSIVPKGHKVRILEKQGLWCRVDVAGEVHGQGWLYAEYLEEILPKAPAAESAMQTVRLEIAAAEQKQGVYPAEPPPAAQPQGEKKFLLATPPSEKASRVGVTSQPSIRNGFRGGKGKSIFVSKEDFAMAGEPVHVPPAQASYGGLKRDAAGINQEASSAGIAPGDATIHQKSLHGGEKKPDEAVQKTPSPVREKAVTDARAAAASMERLAVSREKKGMLNGRESIGPVEMVLKLLAIALSCLVILFLHRANKIATNHYNALMQFQHSLDNR